MTRRSRTSGPLPADVKVSIQALDIGIDHIQKDEVWARCPAHKAQVGHVDRHASWSVNTNTGKHSCFSCGWGGNFLDLVTWMQSTDDEKGREWIRKMGGIEHLRRRIRGDDVYVPPTAEEIGEADLAFFTVPPRWALNVKDVSAEACREYGVLWDPKNNRWVFPIREPYTHRLRGWQEKNSRVFINQPKHMNKADCFFGSHLYTGGPIIVVESPIDAPHIWTYLGTRFGTSLASMGVNLSEEQLQFLTDTGEEVIFALDNDREGMNMSEKIRRKYLGRMPMRFYNYGGYVDKDPGTQSSEEMEWGFENATSSVITRF